MQNVEGHLMQNVLQLVITRTQDGGFKVNEMGLNTEGQGETLRTHDLQPEISADLATKYLVRLLNELVAVEIKTGESNEHLKN